MPFPGPPNHFWQRQVNYVRVPPGGPPRPFPARQIRVSVRVVWEQDGECWIEGTAYAWNEHCVAVMVSDRRCMSHSVWVVPADVRRRPERNEAPDPAP